MRKFSDNPNTKNHAFETNEINSAQETQLISTTSNDVNDSSMKTKKPSLKHIRHWKLFAGILATIILAFGYVGVAWSVSSHIPNNVNVGGIDLSGLSRSEAVNKLQNQLVPKASEPISVTVANSNYNGKIDPKVAGLELDVEGTVDKITEITIDPVKLWNRFTGGESITPVITVDKLKLAQAISDLASEAKQEAKNASLAYKDGQIQATAPIPAVEINQDKAIEVLPKKWLTDAEPLTLESTSENPVLAEKELEAGKTLANKIIAGNITLQVGNTATVLTPQQIADNTSFDASGTEFKAVFAPALQQVIREQAASELPKPRRAGFKIENNQVTIIDSVTGKDIDGNDLSDKILEAVNSPTRSAELNIVNKESDFTTADAQKAGVKEVVFADKAVLNADRERNINVAVAAKKINNTLVLPGETFSFGKEIGEISTAAGFTNGHAITNGRLVNSVGGGVCQVATAAFNLGYQSGMKDDQHKPHSLYFSVYKPGIDATIWYPHVDIKWTNNTPYAVVLHMWVSKNVLHYQIWSTKYWDVNVNVSKPYDYSKPVTKYLGTSSGCVATKGYSGFKVNVSRVVSRNGKTALSNNFSWTYAPMNNYVCSDPPSAEPISDGNEVPNTPAQQSPPPAADSGNN